MSGPTFGLPPQSTPSSPDDLYLREEIDPDAPPLPSSTTPAGGSASPTGQKDTLESEAPIGTTPPPTDPASTEGGVQMRTRSFRTLPPPGPTPNPPPPSTADGSGVAPGAAHITANPWFNVSFLAVFNSVMMQVLSLNKNTQYMEAQAAKKEAQTGLELAKTSANLTKMLYDVQAEQKMVDAISAFASAGVAFAGVAQAAKSTTQARAEIAKEQPQLAANLKTTTTKYNAAETTLQQKETAYQQARSQDDAGGVHVGVAPPPPSGATHQAMVERDAALKERDTAKSQMDSAKTRHGEEVLTRVRNIDMANQQRNDGIRQAIQATTSVIQSGLLTQEGVISAAKTMAEAQKQRVDTLAQDTRSQRDAAGQAIEGAVNLMMKITDSDFRAHSIGGGHG